MRRLFVPTATPHDVNCVRGWLNMPMTIETSSSQWTDVVTFARTSFIPDGPSETRVAMRVDHGRVAVGIRKDATSQFLDEVVVEISNDVRQVSLFSYAPGQIGPIVLRNCSDAGGSQVLLLAIESVALAGAPEVAHPSFSAPLPMPRWNHYFGDQGFSDAERQRAAYFASLAEPALVSFADGLSFQLVPGDQSSRALYVSGTYEPNTLHVLRGLLHPGDVFIDAGANAGLITMAASKWIGATGCICAFEPSAREFARLSDTVSRNHLSQVTMVPAALGAGRAVATLRVADAVHGGLNTLGSDFGYAGIDVAEIESVDVMPLDEFVAERQLSRIAVIKVDVEGFEEEVIAGAANTLERHRPTLVIEVLSRALEAAGSSIERLERRLFDAGYLFHAISDGDASLRPIETLAGSNGENIVAVPRDRRAPWGVS